MIQMFTSHYNFSKRNMGRMNTTISSYSHSKLLHSFADTQVTKKKKKKKSAQAMNNFPEEQTCKAHPLTHYKRDTNIAKPETMRAIDQSARSRAKSAS